MEGVEAVTPEQPHLDAEVALPRPPCRELRGAGREESLTCRCFPQAAGRAEAAGKPSLRKRRFAQFSSLELGGECYMTPRDFLFSVMFERLDRELSLVFQN